MKLTSRELKDFFVGNILGDASLHNGSFAVKQISKDLIDFKAKIIKDHLPNAKIKITYYPASCISGVNRKEYWNLYVSPNEYFKKLEKEFYPNGTKIVPEKYLRDLSPLGYAIWYADDGTTVLVGLNSSTGSAKSRRVQFCTDCFLIEDTKKLSMVVEKQYGNCKIIKRKVNQHRIQINGKNQQDFIISVAPYFQNYFPSLLYKMDLGYRNESLLNRRYVKEEYHNLYIEMSSHKEFVDRIVNRTLNDIV